MTTDSIFETQDGSHSIFSQKYGVSYHSKYGAIQETQHVFIDAGLYYKAQEVKSIDLLEIGFGTGLNAFMTLLEASKNNLQVHYQTVEAFPISFEKAQQLNFSEQLNAPSFQEQFLNMHRMDWGVWQSLSEYFNFKKILNSFEEIDFENAFDLIYFDAFSPSAQEELWEIPLLTKMHKALKKDGVWVSYCAKGSVKRNLKAIGFEVEALKGPPGKREMTRCVKI